MITHDFQNLEPVISDWKKRVPRRPQKSSNISDDEFCKEAQSVVLPPRIRKSLTLSPMYSPTSEDSYMDQCFNDVKFISEGSFGFVFEARSKDDGKLYAVKLFKKRFTCKQQRIVQLEEVHRYARISPSQFCVELIRAWEEDAYLFVQMELCPLNLRQFVKKNEVLEDTLWKILLHLLMGLSHLHAREFIHLDIKPENILVSTDNTFKLADFGLMLDLSLGPVRDANEGDSRYLAPEVLRGVFTKAADIFSLGITMYEVGTSLQLPTHGHCWQELRHGILQYCRFTCQSKELFELISIMMLPAPGGRPSAVKLLKNGKLSSMYRHHRVLTFLRDMGSKMKSLYSNSKLMAVNCGVWFFKPFTSRCPLIWKKSNGKKSCGIKTDLDKIRCSLIQRRSRQGFCERQGPAEKEVKVYRTRLDSCRRRLNFEEVTNKAETNHLASPNRPDIESVVGALRGLSSPKKKRLF